MQVSSNIHNNTLLSNLIQNENLSTHKAQSLNAQNALQSEASSENLAPLNLYQSGLQSASFASEFGFRVDEQGFFENSLIKVANLPLSYDINIKSVQLITKELQKQDSSLEPSRIDLPALLNKYHSTLKAVENEFSSDTNEFLSRFEIANLNQGFSTRSGEFDGQITRVYENQDALKKALNDNKILNPLKLDNKIIDFSFNSALNNTAQNELIKPYLNSSGAVSKSGLLMNFIHKDLKAQNENVDFFIEPVSLNLASHQNFQAMLEGKASFDEYVKEENKQNMSFDLYLYVNGVDKTNASTDKLSMLYQQYVNYQKDMNIKEFANSSSIYQIYTSELSSSFKSMQDDFNANLKDLSSINEQRFSNQQSFLTQRQKLAQLDRINKAYLSVMG